MICEFWQNFSWNHYFLLEHFFSEKGCTYRRTLNRWFIAKREISSSSSVCVVLKTVRQQSAESVATKCDTVGKSTERLYGDAGLTMKIVKNKFKTVQFRKACDDTASTALSRNATPFGNVANSFKTTRVAP